MITGSYVEVGGVRTFVETAGDGIAVLCVHTAGQSAVQWRHVLEDLPQHGFRVIAPDLPGHGRSMPAPDGPIRDLGVYAAWCDQLLGVLGVERPFVVGCSIGGKISLDLAVRAEARIRGVVACACDAHTRFLSAGGLIRSLQDSAAPSRTDRTDLGTLAAVGRGIDPQRVRTIADLHRREDPVITTNDLIGWANHDLREALPQTDCPVVLVAGEDDFWIDQRDARWAAEALPHGRFELLPRVGHYPMEEMPDFSDRLAGWLRDLDQGAR